MAPRPGRPSFAQTYPGRGSELANQRVALSGGQQGIVAPPGGSPAALTNLPVLAAPSGELPAWPAMRSAFFLINRRASAASR